MELLPSCSVYNGVKVLYYLAEFPRLSHTLSKEFNYLCTGMKTGNAPGPSQFLFVLLLPSTMFSAGLLTALLPLFWQKWCSKEKWECEWNLDQVQSLNKFAQDSSSNTACVFPRKNEPLDFFQAIYWTFAPQTNGGKLNPINTHYKHQYLNYTEICLSVYKVQQHLFFQIFPLLHKHILVKFTVYLWLAWSFVYDAVKGKHCCNLPASFVLAYFYDFFPIRLLSRNIMLTYFPYTNILKTFF